MIKINIPGFGQINIEHVVFDYNGTIAMDGELIKGVKEGLALSSLLAADLMVKDTLDVFAFFQTPERLIASLRT